MTWKIAVGSVILIVFIYVGVAHAIDPDRFLKRSGIRKGGEMLTDFNRLQFRIAGLIFATSAGCLLYVLASDVLAK